MKQLACLVLVLAAACGPKSSGSGGTGTGGGGGEPEPSEITCEQSAESLGGKMEASGDMPVEEVEATMEAFIASCEAMGWSVESKQCFADAQDEQGAEACSNGLTQEQRDDMIKRMMENMPKDGPADDDME